MATIAILSGGVARAQPDLPGLEPVLDPEFVLEVLGQAYAIEPVTDVVLVSLRLPGKPIRRGRITIRIEHEDLDISTPRRVLMELGNLRIRADSTQIIVGLSENDSECVIQESLDSETIGQALARLLPPLPVPHLDLLGFNGSANTLTPYVTNPVWTEAIYSLIPNDEGFKLVGEAQGQAISLRIDSKTGRLLEFRAELAAADPQSPKGELVVEAKPAEPDEMIRWTLDAKGRTRLNSITQLRTGTDRITQGQRLPDIRLFDLFLEPWSLAKTLEHRTDAQFIVFLPFALGDGPEIDQANIISAVAGLRVVRSVIESVIIEPVAVVGLADLQREHLSEISRSWAEQAADDPAADPTAVLFGTARARLIDQFVPGAGALMIVVDQQRQLVAAIDLTGQWGHEDLIKAQLQAALALLSEQAPGPEDD